jgi:hypothetical protein
MKKLNYLIVLAAAGLMMGGSSCEKNNPVRLANRETELRQRVQKYHDLIKWRDYQSAVELVAPDKRGEFMSFAQWANEQGIRIEDYVINEVVMEPSAERAAITIHRAFYRLPSVTVQVKDITQEWVLIDGGWYVAGPPY